MPFSHKLARRLAMNYTGAAMTAALLVTACSSDKMSDATSPSIPQEGPASSGTVVITPGNITAETNQPIRFGGYARTEEGDSTGGELIWSASGGIIAQDGTFQADAPGTYQIFLAKGGIKGRPPQDTSDVVVVPPQPTLAAVVVAPDSASVASSAKLTFTASGKLSDGTTSAVGVNWTATGGTIDAGGNYTAGTTAGIYRVIATSTSGTLADTAKVTVTVAPPTAPTVQSIVMTPASASLQAGANQQFAAAAKMSDGTSSTASVTWTATGGTVTAAGLYTAGTTAGTFRVIAKQASGTLADTATVTIAAPTTPPPTEPGTGSGTPGASLPAPLAPSSGQVFYVATTGSDGNSGSSTAPWKTIQKAMTSLQPGQKALVRAGTYETGGAFGTDADTQTWSTSCTATAPCTIEAYPGEKPIIHGQIRINGAYKRMAGFIIEGPLSKDATSPTERRAGQVLIMNAHHVEFARNEVRNNDYHEGIYLKDVNNTHVINNWFHHNGRFNITTDPQTGSSVWNVDHGIYWSGTNGGGNLLANNLIEHNRGAGVQLYPAAKDIIVTNNTVVNNGNTGIGISETSDRITVTNNIVAFNDRNKQIRVRSGSGNVVKDNLVYSPNSSYSGIENSTGSTVTNNVIADPRFSSVTGRNYRLVSGSPAIDRGAASFGTAQDLDGRARPRGTSVDLGGYEY